MVTVENLKVEFGVKPLFSEVGFSVNNKDRIALVGKNGVGKSTLMKIIAGLQQPTSGSVSMSSDETVGYLPQVMRLQDETTVRNEARKAFSNVERMAQKVEHLNRQLQERTDYESDDYLRLVERFTNLQEQYMMIGAEGYWNGEYIFFEDVTFVYNKEGADEVIEMTVYADNGDIYNISYRTPKMPETFNEINLTANAAELYDYTETDGLWEFLGVSEDGMWNISVTGIGDKLVGEYSEDLIYKDFTYIALSDLTFDITLDYGKIDNVKVVEGPEKGDYICTADFYCYNGNLYHVTLNHICPAIKQTVNLNATNLKIAYSDEDGFYIARASDSDYVFAVALEELKNSYAEDELIANEMRRSDNFIYSTYRTYPFTLTYDSNDVPTMKGGCITTDGTEFIFDLTYVLPKPTRNAKLELDVENSELRPNAEDGYFVISGTDSENDIELYLKLAIDEDIAGDYNIKDVDIVNSYIQENASSWSGSYFDIEDIDLNVSVLTGQEDGWDYAFVTGTILCVGEDDDQDIPLYSVVAAMRIKDGLVKDEENKDFVASYTLEDISTIDHSAEEGWILVQGKNVSGQAFAMVFFANSSDPEITIPEGVYEINDTQAEGTVVASSGLDESGWQATASYAAITNMLGFIEGNPWFMVGGNATVKNVEGELSVVVQAKNSYDRDVLIGINAELPTSIDSQSFEIAKPTKSLRDGNIVIERNGKSYNAAGLLIK